MSAAEWPNLFIVGAAKAGTTSLYRYLGRHPDIFMSPVKEPHFFSQIEPDPKLASFFPVVKDGNAYLALFARGRDKPVRGEASTSYLSHPDVALSIKAVSPDARIVIMLRDPISRAYSNYWNNVREGFETRTFEQAIAEEREGDAGRWGVSSLYIDCGVYADRTARYLDVFGEHVLVLFFEEFVEETREHLTRTLAFIGVEPSTLDGIDLDTHNAFALPKNAVGARILRSSTARSAARRLLPRSARAYGRSMLVRPAEKPQMDAETRRDLHLIYRPDVEELTRLIGRRPPWPAFAPPAEAPR